MQRIPILGLGDSLLRVLELNARFYSALGRVTGEFVRELVSTLDVPIGAFDDGRRAPSNGYSHAARADADPPPTPQAAAAPAPAPRPSPITLLEAEAGNWAVGAFTVGNHLDHDVFVRPQASAFFDPPGTGAVPHMLFEPESVTLAPREQILVRMLAAVDASYRPEVRYRCEVSVPALPGSQIPVVIRRRPDRHPLPTPNPPAAEERQAAETHATGTPPAAKPARARPARARKRSRKKPEDAE